MLNPGITKTIEKTVLPAQTARVVGSGSLDVLATPILLAYMEEAAALLAGEHLEGGQTSVGISANLKHLAATPVGMKVTVTATLKEVDRRRLVFSVEAHDERELIATAEHERFIVDGEKFQTKANDKL